MLNNKEKINLILNEIDDSKEFTITNIEFRSDYFIFEHATDSICHFRVQELPDIKLGIWLCEADDDTYEIFGCHEDLIDKFKPSANTCFSNTEDFIKWLNAIQGAPKLFFATGFDFDYILEEDMNNLVEYSENKYNKYYEDKELKVLQAKQDYDRVLVFAKSIIETTANNIMAIYVTDNNSNGSSCSYRFTLMVVFNIDDSTIEETFTLLDSVVDDYNNEVQLLCRQERYRIDRSYVDLSSKYASVHSLEEIQLVHVQDSFNKLVINPKLKYNLELISQLMNFA